MPQPFPSQLMVGFVATYVGGELKVDADELEDARWFPGDALPGPPSRHSISRFIIDNYATAPSPRAPDPHGSPRGERAQRGAARGPCSPG